MNKPSTNRDMQRLTFVESLHSSLKKQTVKAILDHNKFISLASNYVEDGLDDNECIELLMIDGITREAAEGYVLMAQSNKEEVSDSQEYSFQFEDEYGKIWSSYDIGKTINASDDNDAWIKAEEMLNEIEDAQKILSVQRII
jgi:hypothetical protein